MLKYKSIFRLDEESPSPCLGQGLELPCLTGPIRFTAFREEIDEPFLSRTSSNLKPSKVVVDATDCELPKRALWSRISRLSIASVCCRGHYDASVQTSRHCLCT